MGTDKNRLLLGIAIVSVIFVNTACAPKITEEDIKKVENFDPQFKTVLNKKRELELKVSSLENQMAAEKADTEAKISALRSEFQNKKAGLQAQIIEVKAQLEPDKEAIKDKIEELNQELKPLQEKLANIEGMVKDTQSLIEKSKNTNIALHDKGKWDTQIKTLDAEKSKVQKEINGLKDNLRFYELELRILK